MKKTGLGIAALVAVAALSAATSASAADQKPLSGHMELTNFSRACAVAHTPPFLTWAGTVVIDGVTYGWADFPTSELIVDGNFIRVDEYWTIFTLAEGEDVTPDVACDAERVVLAGINDGWGAPGLTGKADGVVTMVADGSPFGDVAVGSRMFWRGKVTNDAMTAFKATLHIQPAV